MKNFLFKIGILACLIIISTAISSCDSGGTSEGTTSSKVKAPKTSIHDAAVAGDLETVQKHITAGTDLNKKDAIGGSTPLMIAIVFDHPEISEKLIAANADLNIKNNDGSTALHTAAFFCRKEVVQALLDAGADKSIKNNFGSTALESVAPPFEQVKGIYDMMGQQLAGFGLKLDMERIEQTRPEIAEMLK